VKEFAAFDTGLFDPFPLPKAGFLKADCLPFAIPFCGVAEVVLDVEEKEGGELDNIFAAAPAVVLEDEEADELDNRFAAAAAVLEEVDALDNLFVPAAAVVEPLDNILLLVEIVLDNLFVAAAEEVEVFEDVDAFENLFVGELALDRLAKVERIGIRGPCDISSLGR
jgi:hypothetical protein